MQFETEFSHVIEQVKCGLAGDFTAWLSAADLLLALLLALPASLGRQVWCRIARCFVCCLLRMCCCVVFVSESLVRCRQSCCLQAGVVLRGALFCVLFVTSMLLFCCFCQKVVSSLSSLILLWELQSFNIVENMTESFTVSPTDIQVYTSCHGYSLAGHCFCHPDTLHTMPWLNKVSQCTCVSLT